MNNSIAQDLPENIAKEFFVYVNGKAVPATSQQIREFVQEADSIPMSLAQALDAKKQGKPIHPKMIALMEELEGDKPISSVLAIKMIEHYAFSSRNPNEEAFRNHFVLRGLPIPSSRKNLTQNTPENDVVIKLHQKLGGVREVEVASGKIDLLTSDQIIEVKNITAWKSAIGQVLSYGNYYPSHQKRIHLFGKCKADLKNTINEICSKLDIVASFE